MTGGCGILQGSGMEPEQIRLAVERLRALMFRDIPLPGCCLRPLGLYFMDHGGDWQVRPHRHSFQEAHLILSGTVETQFGSMAIHPAAGEYYLMLPGTGHAHVQLAGTRHLGLAIRWEFMDGEGRPLAAQSPGTGIPAGLPVPFLQQRCIGPALSWLLDAFLASAFRPEPVMVRQLFFAQVVLGLMAQDETLASDPRALGAPSGGSGVPSGGSGAPSGGSGAPSGGFGVPSCGPVEPSVRAARLDPSTHGFVEEDLFKGFQVADGRDMPPVVHMAERFISENLSQPLSLSDVAHAVHLSASQLSRLYRLHLDRSVMESVREQRICRAMHRLKCTTDSIAEISAHSGFGSDSQFHLEFRRRIGITPLQYRRRIHWLVE